MSTYKDLREATKRAFPYRIARLPESKGGDFAYETPEALLGRGVHFRSDDGRINVVGALTGITLKEGVLFISTSLPEAWGIEGFYFYEDQTWYALVGGRHLQGHLTLR